MVCIERLSITLSLVLTLSAIGCASSRSTTAPSARTSKSHSFFANLFGGGDSHELQSGTGDPEATHAAAPKRVQLQAQLLDVHVIAVPVGAVSRSDEFWKRVDEMNVDPATHDLLYKNGIRVGIARSSEWSYFKSIIDQYPAQARNSTMVGGTGGGMQMEMKKNVPQENIFYFDDENVLKGRTYEKCDNLLGISFQQAPRKPGTVRISVCPTVRSVRKRFEISFHGDEREIEYVAPENLYDLNLITDVPIDGFLVLAPSDLARWGMSLGASFLVGSGVSEKFEQMILLVPRSAQQGSE